MEAWLMGCSSSLVANSLGLLVTAILRHSRYIIDSISSVETRRKEVARLIHFSDELKEKMHIASRNGGEIRAEVDDWRRSADTLIEHLALRNPLPQERSNCFFGVCPNVAKRYRDGKKATKDKARVLQLIEKYNFDCVSRPTPPIGFFNNDDFDEFDSRREAMSQVCEFLRSTKLEKIGVYGLGGVGKTKFISKIAYDLRKEMLFDVVVKSEISDNADLRRIQGEIADGIGFKLNAETVLGRATELRKRLENEKNVLVILDDIWGRIELEEIGIQFKNNGCKVLMASRTLNALNAMGAQRAVEIKVLPETESAEFFMKFLGDSIIDNEEIKSIATEVARKCGGLPIVLATMARALTNGDVQAWKNALKHLEEFKDFDDLVFKAMEVTYKTLRGEELKSLLLLCGQLHSLPISVEQLTRDSLGLGLFQDCRTLQHVRIKIAKGLNDLKASCMLQDGETNGTVTMHEFVHSFAVSMASQNNKVFRVEMGSQLTQWPKNDKFKNCDQMFFLGSKFPPYSAYFECPKLRYLMYNSPDSSETIHGNLFAKTKELQVLNLTSIDLREVPSSLMALHKLRTLCLHYCGLSDISFIGELKTLEILSLRGSAIEELPRKIGQLSSLKLLDLSDCTKLQRIPPKLLSKLSALEELHMRNSFCEWEADECSSSQTNVNLKELISLKKLISLETAIANPSSIRCELFEKLERYKIILGMPHWETPEIFNRGLLTAKALRIWCSNLPNDAKWLLTSAEDVVFRVTSETKHFLNQSDVDGFKQMKYFRVEKDPDVDFIVDATRLGGNPAFPWLKTFELFELPELSKMWKGVAPAGSFRNLETLRVRGCDRLNYLLTFSVAKSLEKLNELEITSCSMLQQVIWEEDDDKEAICLPRLRTICLEELPKLCFFSHTNSSGLFTRKLALPALETLVVHKCPLLKEIVSSGGERASAFPNFISLSLIHLPQLNRFCDCEYVDFPALRKLWIEKCPNMTSFSSSSSALFGNKVTLPLLDDLTVAGLDLVDKIWDESFDEVPFSNVRELTVFDCCSLERVFDVEGKFSDVSAKLRHLTISNLPKLRNVWRSDSLNLITYDNLVSMHVWTCKSLQSIWSSGSGEAIKGENIELLCVSDCPSLRSIFPASFGNNLHRLEFMSIFNCSVETIFEDEFYLPRLKFLTLRNLDALKCFSRGFPILELPLLEELRLYRCDKLRVFSDEPLNEVMPNLSSIAVDRTHAVAFQSQIPSGILRNLKSVELQWFPDISDELVANLTHSLRYMETLKFNGGACKEILSSEIPEWIAELKVYGLLGLGHIMRETPRTSLRLQVFELHLSERLESLNVSAACFGNLRKLGLLECSGLKFVMTSELARNLRNLEYLKVTSCKSVVEIMENGEGDEDEVELSKLENIELVHLPALQSFTSGKCTIRLPSLELLSIKHCYGMKYFARGHLINPTLTSVTFERQGRTNPVWANDLNAIVEQMTIWNSRYI